MLGAQLYHEMSCHVTRCTLTTVLFWMHGYHMQVYSHAATITEFGMSLSSIDAGMVDWAHSRDPILQRYGVGGVARAAIASGAGLAAVMDAGGLKALVSALSEDDPQAQCFAAAALGEDSHLHLLLRRVSGAEFVLDFAVTFTYGVG